MKEVVIVLTCIGYFYAIYSLINFAIKVKKAGKVNCVFHASLSQIIIHGIGIFLLIIAAFIYHKEGIEGWLLFFCLAGNFIIDFIVRSIEFKSIE